MPLLSLNDNDLKPMVAPGRNPDGIFRREVS